MQVLIGTLMLTGCAFLLLAAVGITRMPDLFMRMSASTKASTLGIGLILVALMLHFREVSVITKSTLVLFFFFIMSPVAAHMIARAAYLVGVPLWDRTVVDDAKDHYPSRKRSQAFQAERDRESRSTEESV